MSLAEFLLKYSIFVPVSFENHTEFVKIVMPFIKMVFGTKRNKEILI